VTLIVGYIVRLAFGFALLVPWFACNYSLWNAWFGLSKKPVGALAGAGATFVWFFLAMVAAAGAALIAWVCGDILTRIDPGIAHALELGIWVYIATGYGVSFFAIPIPIYYWKRREFRRLMENLSPRCEKCDYALRGLRIVRGRIRCPECGQANAVRAVVDRFRHDKRVLQADRKELWEIHKE
jgi:hypothetical protein